MKTGRLRGLGVSSAERVTQVPDIPTMAEAGVPGFVAENWWGVWVPAATPKPAVERLQASLAKAMTGAEIKQKFEDMGVEALSSTPEALRDFAKSETEKWGKLVREANIRAD